MRQRPPPYKNGKTNMVRNSTPGNTGPQLTERCSIHCRVPCPHLPLCISGRLPLPGVGEMACWGAPDTCEEDSLNGPRMLTWVFAWSILMVVFAAVLVMLCN